ncbi:MAG: alpha-keto acid decarboxylase family protein [Parachlamydiaceae bacterium]|nr:alpha-keto acid decarboxylase family protein [Parachlamydiaceae bacterium]
MTLTSKSTTTTGQYLLDRLNSLGVEHIFGVPGDYVLRLDKMIEEHKKIKFINTTRESTAGYMADAYARLRGIGVACITYGVGINISNALAQAYVESSPLIVISGTVGTDEFAQHSAMHHMINKSMTSHGDTTQLEIFKHLTIDQGVLDDPKTAAETIDRVLTACLLHKKPVYLELPRNMVTQPIEDPQSKISIQYPQSDKKALQEALEETKKALQSCHHPIIWAGHEILRYGLSKSLLNFAEMNRIPVVSSLLGKTVIDETHPLFVGLYQGEMSSDHVKEVIKKCDCIIIAGVLLNDFETGFFTTKIDQEHHIIVDANSLSIGNHHYKNVSLIDFIQGLEKIKLNLSHPPFHTPKMANLPTKFIPNGNTHTTIKRVFECIQSHLQPSNIVVTDVGDCLFAGADLILSHNAFLACGYFASLGFGVPGAIGAQIADPNRRVVAIVGDGGFQMTATELSAAVRYKLDPIVIVLNNHGYGTERPLIEGTYNDIVDWNYSELPKLLGGGIGIKAETEKAFEDALTNAFGQRGTFYIIEVDLDKLDFSPSLHRLGELLGKLVKGK